jgi:hypothetical protein
MNRRAAFDKLKKILTPPTDPAQRKKLIRKVSVVGGLGFALLVGIPVVKFIFAQGKAVGSAVSAHSFGDVIHAYTDAIDSMTEKFYAIRKAELENSRLKLENANLRLKLESVSFDCSAKGALTATSNLEYRLTKETGAKVGRTLASIPYKPPGHLLPPQLHTLAVSYFRAGEYEKAAVNLTFLTGLDENDSYKTAKNFLMAGVSWYRIDNFELADHYFDKTLSTSETPETIQWHAQARLWRALSFKRVGKNKDSQLWLRELIDHHPHSTEAAWVNSKESEAGSARGGETTTGEDREPASEQHSEKKAEE